MQYKVCVSLCILCAQPPAHVKFSEILYTIMYQYFVHLAMEPRSALPSVCYRCAQVHAIGAAPTAKALCAPEPVVIHDKRINGEGQVAKLLHVPV